VIAHSIFIHYVHEDVLVPHREVAGFLVAIVGVVYAVALGFAVVTVWVQFNDAQRTADTEAGDAGELAALSALFAEPARTRLRTLIVEAACW
jgi:hypothetical protein